MDEWPDIIYDAKEVREHPCLCPRPFCRQIADEHLELIEKYNRLKTENIRNKNELSELRNVAGFCFALSVIMFVIMVFIVDWFD